jgi:hypothetical protein
MPFEPYQYNAATTVQNNFDFCQLLPTGDVFASVGSFAYLLSPDANGSYNHPNWRRTTNIPYSSLAGTVTILNDGRMMVHASEHGANQISLTQYFDPINESWVVTDRIISYHTSSNLLDDGKILTHHTITPADGDIAKATLYPTFAWQNAESQLINTPDGRFIEFAIDGKTVQVIRPQNAAAQVAEGSFNGDNTVVFTDFSTTLTTFLDFRSRVASWTSNGGIKYEVGPTGWMPKIEKAVIVGGQGWIVTYDLTAPGYLNKAAVVPMNPLPQNPNLPDPTITSRILGKVPLEFNAMNGTQVQTQGTFTMNVTGSVTSIAVELNSWPVKHFFVRIGYSSSNPAGTSGFIGFVFTTAIANVSNNTITFTGVTLQPNHGDYSTTMQNGSDVYWGRPSPISQDAPGTFLPNGDLIFLASIEDRPADNYFNGVPRYYKWDGVSPEAVPLTVDNTSKVTLIDAYLCQMFNLPDGTIFCKEIGDASGRINNNSPSFRIYTPTTSEATPFPGSKPSIIYFPSSVEANQSCRLYGTQLNGLHEGGLYGDDGSPRSNFPIVRFKNTSTNQVYTCRTHSYTYRGIGKNRPSSAIVQIPNNIPDGIYNMTTVAGGISSDSQQVIVKSGTMGENIFINSYR